MNKTDFIKLVSDKTKQPVSQVGKTLVTILESITKLLVKGDSITFVGFGTFKTQKRSARIGRNPQTGAAIKIPARKVPRFSAGKKLKEAVRK